MHKVCRKQILLEEKNVDPESQGPDKKEASISSWNAFIILREQRRVSRLANEHSVDPWPGPRLKAKGLKLTAYGLGKKKVGRILPIWLLPHLFCVQKHDMRKRHK